MVRKDLEWMENRLTERFDAGLAMLGQRLTIKLRGMMMAAVGIVAALVKLL